MNQEPEDRDDLDLDQALLEFMRRFDAGNPEDRESFLKRYPQLAERLKELLLTADWIESMAGPIIEQNSKEDPKRYPSEEGLGRSDSSDREEDVDLSSSPNPNSVTVPMYSIRGTMPSPDESTLPPRVGIDDASLARLPSMDNTYATLPCRFGDYVLEKVLGRGGMGVVYLANQTNLDRRVAVKMIRSGALASNDEVNRFYAEARSAGSLDHPSIITIYHCGEHEGHHFFSMDYVPGTDLAKKLSGGPMNAKEAVRYVRDVARAIDYAHSRGVVHRDLKPANVLITESDEVVLTDFGLAKRMGSDDGLTATGAALGTPSYMSPEQAAGKSEEHSASTDVYAIGAILYALLVGKPPFQADSVLQTMMQVMNKPAPSVRSVRRDVHPDLDTIVLKCLEKTPSRRYVSARDLAEDLERFYQGSPITARPPSALRKIRYWFSNVPIVAALAGIRNVEPTRSQRVTQNVLLLLLVLFISVWFFGPSVSNHLRNNIFPSKLTIASGAPGGMYFQLAGQIAGQIQKTTGRVPTVIPTNGSIENLNLLGDNRSQLALMQESAIRSDKVSVVAPLFYEAIHILVRKNLAIRSIQELASQKIMLGTKESGTRQAAVRVLGHFGIQVDKLAIIDGDWHQKDLRDQADVVVAVIKVGQAGIAEMLNEEGFELLSLQNVASLALDEPMFRPYEIALRDYRLDSDTKIQTLATTALLVVKKDASNRLVQETLDAIYLEENKIPGLIPAEIAAAWQGLPYHEAARKFFSAFDK